MDLKNKLEKMEKILNFHFVDTPNFLDRLNALNTYLVSDLNDHTEALAPNEPNFQLPNVFLRTKKVAEFGKINQKLRHIEDAEGWNEIVDKYIKRFEDFEFYEPEFSDEKNDEELGSDMVNELIKIRYGY
ncbi:hypothetical protein TCON_1841 [Astathelohania contejeani]|uniref:Uncharacterized protein n=1 Tax=Astathelohania contejeani TaxID=164912 RepID=A0ABQ7HXP7_9MICR|nr:hypothetical protein TCON_1841 [Thelohania contejeani]